MTTLIGAKTHFSLGQSILSPDDVVRIAKDKGYSEVAVADVGNLNALPALNKAGKKHDVRIIIGVTMRVVDDIEWRRAKRSEPKAKPNPFFMPKLYAKNEDGLKDIMRLISLSNDPDHFYYLAQIDQAELLATVSLGNVVVTTGDASSVFSHADANNIIDQLHAASPSDVYAEVIPDANAYYTKITEYAFATTLPSIVTRPVLFKEGEATYRDTLSAIVARNEVDSNFRSEIHTDLFVKSPVEMFELAKPGDWTQAFASLDTFGEQAAYEFSPMPVLLPNLSDDPFKTLVELSMTGWNKRLKKKVMGYQPDTELMPVYRARLKYELKTLKQMGFESYFLLVEHIITWSKQNDIMVGPGRGSAGGSLVSFLLGITDVDPIRFNLIFERFINPERLDLPDIDIDFMSTRKQEVHQYLIDTWGEDHVAGISNYTMLQSSSALRSVAKAHGLKDADVNCAKYVPKDSGTPVSLEEAAISVPEIEQFSIDHPKIWKEACMLQGKFRAYGTHAAGVVVSGTPLTNRAVVETRKDHAVIAWDKRIVEDFGLVKLDVLGLTTLDVLSMARQYVIERTGEIIEYTDLPLDDLKVMEAFSRGETLGVFQFEGSGMRHLLKELALDTTLDFMDIVATTALFRPGPMESGLMDDFIQIKQGNRYPSYVHENMKPALEETQSVLIYQEQVMQIARDLSGFSMAQADHLRKAMGKKNPEEMAKSRDQFVDGAVEHSGMKADVATELFDQIEKFAGYGFNKSHAVEYSVISYWSMFMKINHPAAFFAAALSVLGDEKKPGIVKEAMTYGVTIYPPDINISTNRFEIEYVDDAFNLYAPFSALKGASQKTSDAILTAREKALGKFTSKEHFLELVVKRSCNIRAQESLDLVGAFSSIEEDQLPPLHNSRLRDQKELLPGIINTSVKATRKVASDRSAIDDLLKILADCTMAGEKIGQNKMIMPKFGSSPRIMIVTDFPNWTEVAAMEMGAGDGSASVRIAMSNAGLTSTSTYMTALVKCPKDKEIEGGISTEMVRTYAPFLTEEVDRLKPPVILALGSKAIRHFKPDVKGGWAELFGQEHYDKDLDATIIFGLSPGMVHFDKTKQTMLDEVFKMAADLTKVPSKVS